MLELGKHQSAFYCSNLAHISTDTCTHCIEYIYLYIHVHVHSYKYVHIHYFHLLFSFVYQAALANGDIKRFIDGGQVFYSFREIRCKLRSVRLSMYLDADALHKNDWDHRARVLSMRIEMCSYVISDGLEVRLGEGHDRLEGDQAWSGHRPQGITCDMYFCYVRKHFIPRCLQQIKLRQNHC